MNGQGNVTRRMFRTTSHLLMVHARVLEAFIHFTLMYAADIILTVLPIKDLIKKDGKPTTPYKLATGMKSPILHLCVLFFPCVVKNVLHMLVHRR